ncbi:BTB/POZ domain-containing protein 9-like protein, partial [Dinothrombium tinctorium]
MDANDCWKNKISRLYLNQDLSDICFVVENERIFAHKLILAINCHYFRTLLYGAFAESKSNEIVLRQTPKAAFLLILHYIYKGYVNCEQMSVNESLSLLSLAHEYQIDELVSLVEKQFKDDALNLENIVDIYNVAFHCEIESLINKCLLFLELNSEQVVSDHSLFASLPLSLLNQILDRDTFYAKEVDLFKALVCWQKVNASIDAKNLFSMLRLNLIEPQEFNDFVRPFDIYSDSDYVIACKEDKKLRKKVNLYISPNTWFCDCYRKWHSDLKHIMECSTVRKVLYELKIARKFSCIEFEAQCSLLSKSSHFYLAVGIEKSILTAIYKYKVESNCSSNHKVTFPLQNIKFIHFDTDNIRIKI